jgi:hypothetical protein
MLTVSPALFGCSSTPPDSRPKQDTELLNAARSAQQAYQRGQFETAANQYRLALQRARVMDAAGSIGDQAYNLALSLIAADQLDAAQALLDEAERELTRAGEPLADVLLTQARLVRVRSGRGASAAIERQLRRVLDDPRSQATPVHRAQVALLRADLACDRGDGATAADYLAESQALLGAEPPTTPIHAHIARVRGRIHGLNNEPEQAGRTFDEEADIMRANRRYRDMAKALRRGGDAYRQAGKAATAVDRYYRAARSWLAQGRSAEAAQDMSAAEQLAGQLRDDQWRRRLALLRAEHPADPGD